MADLHEYFKYYAKPGEACYLVCEHAKLLEAVVTGLSLLLPDPVRAFHFQGDYILPGEGDRLLQPLLKGETVVLVCYGHTPLCATFADRWHRYGKGDIGYTKVARHFYFNLNRSKAQEKRGALVVLQITGGFPPELIGSWVRRLDDDDIPHIEEASGQSSTPIIKLRSRMRMTEPRVTMKDLCLLHLRDGTTLRPIDTRTVDRDSPVTWADLQEMLRKDWSAVEADLEILRQRGLIDNEKWEYYLAACDYIEEYKGSEIRSNIYEAVWLHEFLEDGEAVFRGQGDIQWRLDTTLFRGKSDGTPLDVGTLYERIRFTNEFLTELGSRQQEFFGAQLKENELLAIAQHYGFPTSLLDFTRSFRVAAFFATLDARRISDTDEMIGAIYWLKPTHTEFQLQNEENLEEAIGIEKFHLLHETGIRLGKWQYIEPNIPEEDNRIARQKGVFIEGYQVRDLRQIAIERVYFHQQPGEVFEDPAAGVTESILLPDRSRVNDLAKEVKSRFKSVGQGKVQTELGRTLVPAAGIIGSIGAELYSQLDEGKHFFKKLKGLIADSGNSSILEHLDSIFKDYFQGVRSLADIGNLPIPGQGEYDLTSLKLAVSRLEEEAGIEKGHLWKLISEFIPGNDKDWQPMYRGPEMSQTPANDRERIALACALYLVGWEHLFTVNGWKARGFCRKALNVLYSFGGAGPTGI